MRKSLLLLFLSFSCAPGGTTEPAPDEGAADPFDVVVDGASEHERDVFDEGDTLFDLPLKDGDGLGPLYTRTSCSACHTEGTRGPGLVQKIAVVEADGFTPASDQSLLAFGHTVHPLTAAGAKTPIAAPPDPRVKVSIRVGPPVLGRGYMEAIEDAEIERVAREQSSRSDGIHGRVNHVVYASEPNADTRVHAYRRGDVVIGRFGLKARIATLDDFTADALQGDMGITSPLRPKELPNPDGLLDDRKAGVDVTLESVNKRADYLRLIAIPRRRLAERGRALFEQVKCAVCHVPSMKTRADYPIAALAGIDAAIYGDMLLHDMGPELADGLPVGQDGEATSREWRTAPLIGLRFVKNYLHDSRAHSVDEAIRMHGGPGSQAGVSVGLYSALSDDDRQALVQFVEAL